MRERILYLLKTWLLTVITFLVAKITFLLINHDGHTFTVTDVVEVLAHGLTLDLSTSLYFLILPFLVSLLTIWWERKWLGTLLNVYYAIISIALMTAFVADTSLYPFWGFKLDAACLQYLETPAEARASVSGGYMVARLIIIIVGSILLCRLYISIPRWTRKPTYRKGATLGDLLVIPLLIIGIRGGLDESTTNIGQVYYSQDQFLNHAAVNPVFSFFASLEKTANQNANYTFFSDEECTALTKGLFTTESIGADSLLNTSRPNVVVILMESCSNLFMKAMPNLNRLRQEGVWFSNCYGNSFRTDRGTVCTLSGYPSFPTMSVMKMPKKTASLPSIARTLQSEGYHTHYLYGGDINFTNMRSYLVGTGWEKLTWKADYTADEQNSAKWGVRDDITFGTLYDMITQLPADSIGERTLIGYSTLSSHEPWDVPIKKYNDEKMNAFYYLDKCLGELITKVKNTPQWENLLIILIPDHGINYKEIDETHRERNHIPMVWTGGAVKQPRHIDAFCNQTDLAATLLGQMDIGHEDFQFSRDVLSQSYANPFAMHCYNNGFSIVDSTGFMVYDLTPDHIAVKQSSRAEEWAKRGKAILQLTAKDLNQR